MSREFSDSFYVVRNSKEKSQSLSCYDGFESYHLIELPCLCLGPAVRIHNNNKKRQQWKRGGGGGGKGGGLATRRFSPSVPAIGVAANRSRIRNSISYRSVVRLTHPPPPPPPPPSSPFQQQLEIINFSFWLVRLLRAGHANHRRRRLPAGPRTAGCGTHRGRPVPASSLEAGGAGTVNPRRRAGETPGANLTDASGGGRALIFGISAINFLIRDFKSE